MNSFLHSTRLSLRAVEPEDLDLMYSIENDSSLWQWVNTTVPYSRYALRRYLEETTCDIYADKALRLVIESAAGEAIGFIDLQNVDPAHHRAEVGIVLLSAYQHKGFAAEALRLLADYAAQHLHLHQLFAIVAQRNTAAIHLFQHADFDTVATLPQWLFTSTAQYENAILLARILGKA